MKIAKASADDIRSILLFFDFLEQALESGDYLAPDATEGDQATPIGPQELHERLAVHWAHLGGNVGSSWRRVIHGYDTLLQNCCDPDATTLEWRPDLQEKFDRLDKLIEILERPNVLLNVPRAPRLEISRLIHGEDEAKEI